MSKLFAGVLKDDGFEPGKFFFLERIKILYFNNEI